MPLVTEYPIVSITSGAGFALTLGTIVKASSGTAVLSPGYIVL